MKKKVKYLGEESREAKIIMPQGRENVWTR